MLEEKQDRMKDPKEPNAPHSSDKISDNVPDHESDILENQKEDGAVAHQEEGKGEDLVDFFRQLIILFIAVFMVRSFIFEPFQIPSGSMIPTLLVGDYVGVTKFSYGYSKYALPLGLPLWSGRFFAQTPQRGDVAVFRYTQDTSIDYIKRIVGLPGDHIRMIGGKLFINGHELERISQGHYEIRDEGGRLLSGERYREAVPRGVQNAAQGFVTHDILKLRNDDDANNTPDYIVPQGCFFAMGDDRDDSADSRFQGGRDTGKCAAPPGNDFIKSGMKDLGFIPFENLVGRAQIILLSIDWQHPHWEFWYWPVEIRWNRFMHRIL